MKSLAFLRAQRPAGDPYITSPTNDLKSFLSFDDDDAPDTFSTRSRSTSRSNIPRSQRLPGLSSAPAYTEQFTPLSPMDFASPVLDLEEPLFPRPPVPPPSIPHGMVGPHTPRTPQSAPPGRIRSKTVSHGREMEHQQQRKRSKSGTRGDSLRELARDFPMPPLPTATSSRTVTPTKEPSKPPTPSTPKASAMPQLTRVTRAPERPSTAPELSSNTSIHSSNSSTSGTSFTSEPPSPATPPMPSTPEITIQRDTVVIVRTTHPLPQMDNVWTDLLQEVDEDHQMLLQVRNRSQSAPNVWQGLVRDIDQELDALARAYGVDGPKTPRSGTFDASQPPRSPVAHSRAHSSVEMSKSPFNAPHTRPLAVRRTASSAELRTRAPPTWVPVDVTPNDDARTTIRQRRRAKVVDLRPPSAWGTTRFNAPLPQVPESPRVNDTFVDGGSTDATTRSRARTISASSVSQGSQSYASRPGPTLPANPASFRGLRTAA